MVGLLLLRRWKYCLAALLIVLAGVGGYYGHKPQDVVKIQDRIVEKVVTVHDKISHNNKTTTIKVNKDGSKTTTIVDKSVVSSQQKVDDAKAESVHETKQTAPAADPYRPSYSLGAEAAYRAGDKAVTPRITAGYRVLGNLWGTGSVDPLTKEIAVGVRIDF